MSYEEERWNERQDLLVRVVANRIYQQHRMSHYEFRDGFVKASSLVAGAAVFANIASKEVVLVATGAIFAGTAFSLVFGWGAKSRDSAKRSAEWTQLESEIAAVGRHEFDPHLNAWTARANNIEVGEPAQSKGMWCRAYLQACKVLGREPLRSPSWWERNRPALLVP